MRKKRKLAAVLRETPKNTRENQSQNALNARMAEEYITQVSTKIEGRDSKKHSKEFSWTRILEDLSNLDEFLLNAQVRTCFLVVSGKSRNINSANWERTVGRSLSDPILDEVFLACHTSNQSDSQQ